MKKIAIIAATAAVLSFFCGCGGQDINMTVYNDTGILPTAETYCGARVEWDKGTTAQLFSGSGNDVTSSNSFTVQVKEGYSVKVIGYGTYYTVIDAAVGNTKLASYAQTATASVYGGYMEAANWYACLYLDKVLIYKK